MASREQQRWGDVSGLWVHTVDHWSQGRTPLPTLVAISWVDIPDGLSCFVLPVWGEDTLAEPGCPVEASFPISRHFSP